MITQILQNLIRPGHLHHAQSGNLSILPNKTDNSLLRVAFSNIKDRLVKILGQKTVETEVLEAIQHLHDLTDEQLLDMGITRMDIAHVVRHGKD